MAGQAQTPQPTAAHRRLDIFVGKWRATGDSYADGQEADDPLASAVRWTSDETYEWLPGGFFLLHRFDAMAGKRVFKGTEIIGFEEARGGYFSRFFDNAGNHPEYLITVQANVWTFSEPATRATVTESDDGQRMTFKWEWRNGGSNWLALCDRVAQRVS